MSPELDKKPNSFKQGLWEWIKVIVVALAISLPIRYYIAEPFIVDGASMDPAFSTGQFLIVDRVTYRFEAPHRGDVIVFKYPNNPSVYYIKRIIGLPGETVHMKDGKVTITAPAGEGAATTTEIVLDESYVASGHVSSDNLTSSVLGPSQYYVMGDNRTASYDSRAWGPVDAKLIVGRPVVRLLPLTALAFIPGDSHK